MTKVQIRRSTRALSHVKRALEWLSVAAGEDWAGGEDLWDLNEARTSLVNARRTLSRVCAKGSTTGER